jgi:hypothetical protein
VKTQTLPIEGLTLERLLAEAKQGEVLFLTEEGSVRLAILPADEGDAEAASMRDNAELMAYFVGCSERAAIQPRKTLQQFRESLASQ